MSKDPLYVLTALECIEKISIYSKGFDSGEALFQANDQLNYNAVIKLISVIGEEISKIGSKLLVNHEIDWQAIKGTRNRIVHDYRGLDRDIIYSIIETELPKLKEALIEIYEGFEMPADLTKVLFKSPHYAHVKYLFR